MVGAVLLAHQDLARALVTLYIYMESVRIDIVGAHGAGQVETTLLIQGRSRPRW